SSVLSAIVRTTAGRRSPLSYDVSHAGKPHAGSPRSRVIATSSLACSFGSPTRGGTTPCYGTPRALGGSELAHGHALHLKPNVRPRPPVERRAATAVNRNSSRRSFRFFIRSRGGGGRWRVSRRLSARGQEPDDHRNQDKRKNSKHRPEEEPARLAGFF